MQPLKTAKLLAAAAALSFPLALMAAAPASADSASEALYSRYHQSAEVAKLCRNLEFDQADIDRMAAIIHAKINHDIGAKRLSLLTKAQRDGRALVQQEGCDSASAQELLALFDSDLASAVQ